MKIKRFLCLLLVVFMAAGVFASCSGEEPEEGGKPPQTNTGSNNGGSGNGSGNGGNSGGGTTPGEGDGTVTEKYPWLNRIYRFSEEKFTIAPGEQDGIVSYLKSIGAIAAEETDAEKITKVLDTLGYAYRNQVQFATANTVKIVSDDYIKEENYIYKFDVYKNLLLYDVNDTAMKNNLTDFSYTLSLDGKSLTLKVPFSYVTVDGEGNPTTVSCKSYSTLTFTRDEAVKLDSVPDVADKAYKLHNFAYRFVSEEALADFESEKGMSVDAFLAIENAQITESNSGVLRVEANNKLVCEKIVGSGIAISEFSYYISIGAGGTVTLYNTEKGRDDKDENDVVTAVSVSFTPDGKSAVVSEGTDVQRLRVYTFDKAIEEEIVPGVGGKAYKLSEYTYRFASDSDRVALETAQGKSLDAIIAELNDTITEKRYNTLTVTDDGKVVCETVTESGSIISQFTYFAITHEDGTMTLYKTAAGRAAENADDLVTDIVITVTASGVEVATPISAGSESMQIEVYVFEKNFEKESVSNPKGNAYRISGYGFKFASEADIAALESAEGKTVAEIISALNASITESAYRTLTVDKNVKFVCTSVSAGGVTATIFIYYGVIGENGKVTVYKTAAGRDAENTDDLVTDVAITVTSKGIEVATPIPEIPSSKQTELYVFDKAIEKSNTDVLGNSYLLDDYNYRFDSAEALEDFEEAKGKTVAEVLTEEKANISEQNKKWFTIDGDGHMILYQNLATDVSVGLLRGYADIADDGTVTLYASSQGRDTKNESNLVITDISIRITANGIELSYPITGGAHIELYAFESELPVYNGIPTVAGASFEGSGGEIRYHDQNEKKFFDRSGLTQSMIFSVLNNQTRRVYLDTFGRIYSISSSNKIEWLYWFAVNEDGSITRYKTENGRDNQIKSDVFTDGSSFYVSPDGSGLEWKMLIDGSHLSYVVIFLDFKETMQEDTPNLSNKVYLSDDADPLIWMFDGSGTLTAFQNNAIMYTYYAKITAGKASFYTDPDARDRGDENYLVSSLSADLLLNGSVLLLSNGTTLHYNDAYTKAKTPMLSFGSNVKTEYVEASNLNIDLSGNLTTNSDGAKIFQWFEGRGMYKSPITSAPKTEGEYTLRVTTMPTANYQTASAEIVITVITYDELVYGATTVSEPPTGSAIRSKTVDVKTGETYVLHVSGCDDYYENRSECINIYLRNLSAPTSFRLFRETNGVIEEFEAYLDSDDKVRYKSNGVDTPLTIKQSDTSSYYIVWTASGDQTVTVKYDRTKLM